METEHKLALLYQPRICKDLHEPFPIRYLGYTLFRERGESRSFPDLTLDPEELGAAYIIEYAVYYDYDIQHLYDLEHVWTAVDQTGGVTGCWGSFHGMRLRVDRLPAFRLEGTHPVLYAQPGKHALLPDPALFWLNDQFPESCGPKAGGGLLVPPMLEGRLQTDAAQDRMIAQHIRERFVFSPALQYEPETVEPEQVIPWPELLEKIPQMVEEELARIRQSQ
ncbi:MAG: hypothetical protein HDT18_00955 [Oscillibacter sp.]|nr:hypothetical protein [Oscillibacter sp.]